MIFATLYLVGALIAFLFLFADVRRHGEEDHFTGLDLAAMSAIWPVWLAILVFDAVRGRA